MVTLLDVSAVVGHHAMPAALLFLGTKVCKNIGQEAQQNKSRAAPPHIKSVHSRIYCKNSKNWDT